MLLFYPTLVRVSSSDWVYFFQLGIFQQPIPASRLATDRQLTWSWMLVGSIWSSFGPWDGLKIWDTWKGRGYLQMMKWQPWSCGFLAFKKFLFSWKQYLTAPQPLLRTYKSKKGMNNLRNKKILRKIVRKLT